MSARLPSSPYSLALKRSLRLHGDDHVLGIGDDTADAAEIVRQSGAQHLDPEGVATAEVGVGHRRQRPARASLATPPHPRHAGGALPKAQISLRTKLGIGAHHHPPRDADLARQVVVDGTRATGRRAPSRIVCRTGPRSAPSVREPSRLAERSSSSG
jgi:hypothetical protein